MKKNKRSKTKYPGLTKQTTLRIREDLVDQDYIEQLNESEKVWLNQFNEEWINMKVSKTGNFKPKFHKTKKDRKLINDRNNSRNRDIYSLTAKDKKLTNDIKADNNNFYVIEDEMNERIDAETELENIYKEILKKRSV